MTPWCKEITEISPAAPKVGVSMYHLGGKWHPKYASHDFYGANGVYIIGETHPDLERKYSLYMSTGIAGGSSTAEHEYKEAGGTVQKIPLSGLSYITSGPTLDSIMPDLRTALEVKKARSF